MTNAKKTNNVSPIVGIEDLQIENANLRKKLKKFTSVKAGKAIAKAKKERALRPYQAEIIRLQNYLELTKRRMIIVCEGRDASGKGGTIRRITRYMNEKRYRVVALGNRAKCSVHSGFFNAMLNIPAWR